MRIETPRLLIRSLQPQDAQPLADLWADPEVTRHMGGPRDADELLRSILEDARAPEPPRFDLWPVVEKARGTVIGHCGLLDKEVDGAAETELVYVLAKEAWGRGLATEAAQALREYAFRELGLARLIALIEPENAASRRVAENVGMRLEKETIRPGDRRMHVYSLANPSLRGRPPGAAAR